MRLKQDEEAPDLKRLPAAYRRYIERLEIRIADLKQALDAPEKTRIIVEPYNETPRYLRNRSSVRFVVGENGEDWIDCSLRTPGTLGGEGMGVGALQLHGGRALLVLPSASNSAYVKTGRW